MFVFSSKRLVVLTVPGIGMLVMLRNHIKLVWVRPFDLNDISIGINFLLEGEVGGGDGGRILLFILKMTVILSFEQH